MEYSYITEPLIGALIGYSTNWIAIKMMFRPRKAVMLGKIKLPFTPGVIPKNRENIARTIATVITNNLLTEEDLKNNLLSKEIKDKIKNMIHTTMNNNEVTLKELVVNNVGTKSYEKNYNIIVDKVFEGIYKSIKEKNIVNVLEKQIQIAVEKKISGSVFAFLGGNKMVQPIINVITEQIEGYIDSDGKRLIREMVNIEMDKYMSVKITEISSFNIEEMVIKLYEKVIINKLGDFFEERNLDKMIENKINSMKIEELERLILSVMNKELKAIVNLGAIIGFALGLCNLLF